MLCRHAKQQYSSFSLPSESTWDSGTALLCGSPTLTDTVRIAAHVKSKQTNSNNRTAAMIAEYLTQEKNILPEKQSVHKLLVFLLFLKFQFQHRLWIFLIVEFDCERFLFLKPFNLSRKYFSTVVCSSHYQLFTLFHNDRMFILRDYVRKCPVSSALSKCNLYLFVFCCDYHRFNHITFVFTHLYFLQ